MCGIAGVINVKDGKNVVSKMLTSIRHRGPDGEGIKEYTNGMMVLGHVRLSIIDLSKYASQPMNDEKNRYSITYNGELYNYKELKKELQLLGVSFFSNSDTEVVLKSYMHWGKKCIDKFNGMFSFAIWDDFEKKLFMARDRYGIKPVYYTTIANSFLFASEQKAIMQYEGFERKINPHILKEYFTFQNILSQDMLLDNIKILPAGCYMEIYPNCEKNKITRYWDYHFREPNSKCSRIEYEEQLRELFKKAIHRQLISDVEIGSYLSGGMDSGSITAVASKEIPDLKTFTCGFDLHSASGIELSYDEREKSEWMSYLFGTEHYEIVLKAGDMEKCMSNLVWAIEEPRVGQSYPNYYASKLASKFVKVVLSGAGGDELFGGYPWRYYRSVNSGSFEEYIDNYYSFWQRLLPQEKIDYLLSPVADETKDLDMREVFKEVFRPVLDRTISPEQCINHSLYFEAKTFLHGLLVVEDKLSMSHGMETRVPFLDNDLVDFAMRLPVSEKIAKLDKVIRMDENEIASKREKYYQRTNDGKILLRNVMNGILPREIVKAEKQGFVPPDGAWFKGESIEYIKNVVFDNNAKMYDYLDKNMTQKLVVEHLSGEKNYRLFIWSILVFHQWCKMFL